MTPLETIHQEVEIQTVPNTGQVNQKKIHQTQKSTVRNAPDKGVHQKMYLTEECTKKRKTVYKNGPDRGVYQTTNVTDRGFHQTIKGHQTRPVHLQQICCLCAVRYNVEILFIFD